MVLLTFIANSRKVMDPLIHLPYTLGEVEDPYLVGFLDIVIDIFHVLFEYTIVILSH